MNCHTLRPRAIAAAALSLLVAACGTDDVTRSHPSLQDGSSRQVTGTMSIVVMKPGGMEVVSRDEPWSATATANDGVLAPSRQAQFAGMQSVSPVVLASDDAEYGAMAAPPILALRAGHSLTRGRPNEAYASRFVANGHEYTVAFLHGPTGGPAQRVVYFEDGKAVHTARFAWEMVGGTWQLTESVVSTWRDGRPTGAVITRVNGRRDVSAAGERSTSALLADASNSILDALAFVAQKTLLPSVAHAQSTKKFYFTECAGQWLGVTGAGLALTIALHPASGPIEKLKVATYAHGLLAAYGMLAKCVGEMRLRDAQQESPQLVSGDVVYYDDEPLSWADMPPEVQQALAELAAYCQTEPFDLTCGEFAVAY